MSSKFFTNKNSDTLLDKFKGIFKNNPDISNFDALVGFLRSSGYFKIRKFLEKVDHVRILVGINVDSIIKKYHEKGLEFFEDKNLTKEQFKIQLKEDILTSTYSSETENGIIQFVEDIANNKIKIRAHPSKKIHAKIYIFKPQNFNEHKSGSVISGSSNLTDSGLGVDINSNYEFNVELKDFDDVSFASKEFEKLWNESIDILFEDLNFIKKDTYLNNDISPYELYMKLLIEYFGSTVNFDSSAVLDLPKKYKQLDYQIDAVNEGFNLLQKHTGFFLSDVVGTGKTLVSILIAKKFFNYNLQQYGHINNTLIIAPVTVKESWIETLEELNLQNYEFIANRSFHKIKNPNKYDLIIVDEAHKFKSNTATSYNELQRLCKSPTNNILENDTCLAKRVILISASPLNNGPLDIKNQILLFQDGRNSTLEIGNLDNFFNQKIEAYKKVKTLRDKSEIKKEIKQIYGEIREKIISQIMVRRTRTDLIENKQYKKNLDDQGIIFPEVGKPNKILYKLNSDLELLYDETISMFSKLNFAIYDEIKYLKPEFKNKFSIPDVAYSALADIMKTLLVKRLDSSFHAFKKTFTKFYNKTNSKIQQFENDRIYILNSTNLDISNYILEDREDEIINLVNDQSEDEYIYSKENFEDELYEKLKFDFDLITPIISKWNDIFSDPKYDEFLRNLKFKFFNKDINHEGKLVVFSESKVTADYLFDKLSSDGFDKVLKVDASNRDNLTDILASEFDANYGGKQTNNYNILLTTEVLAEGINLHRSNVIINYDTPWNSTRLIQRIGRVNRIGTKAKKIHIFNFFPTSNVENDIKLEQKAFLKLQSFHEALGEDSQIFDESEETQSFGLFDKNMEESKDLKLSFLMELRDFKENNEKLYRQLKQKSKRQRVGRKINMYKKSSISFIKNDIRNAFYFIDEKNNIIEKTFIEAANIFKAKINEKSFKLHLNHHDHINSSINHFNEEQQNTEINKHVVNTKLSTQATTAIKFLDACLKFDFLSETEINTIKQSIEFIKIQKFINLQRDINRFTKQIKLKQIMPTEIIDILIKILEKFTQNNSFKTVKNISINPKVDVKPEIIISESFS